VRRDIARHLDDLVDGFAGAAFHGVIRLAYALDVASPARIPRVLRISPRRHVPWLAQRRRDNQRRSRALLLELAGEWEWQPDDSVATSPAHALSCGPARFATVARPSPSTNDIRPSVRRGTSVVREYRRLYGVTRRYRVGGDLAPAALRERRRTIDRSTFQALAAAYLSIGAQTSGQRCSSVRWRIKGLWTSPSRDTSGLQ